MFVNKQSMILFLVLCLGVFGITPLYAHGPKEDVHGSASLNNGKDLLRLGATVYKLSLIHI